MTMLNQKSHSVPVKIARYYSWWGLDRNTLANMDTQYVFRTFKL